MSRADWSFLEHLLEEGQEYSTAIGRVWLTVLFLFRMLVLGTAAESAWDDEQAGFVCNTKQPGCTAVCYDKAFPLSHFRYFVLQVIFVSTPTIFYFGYVAIRAQKDKRNGEDGGDGQRGEVVIEKYDSYATKDNAEEKEKEKSGGRGRKANKPSPEGPKLKGRLLAAYTFSILLKVLLEAGFIVGLWFLYNGFFIKEKYECTISPCPHTVDCFVSRPTEKTVFTIYTQTIAAISLLLNLIELIHLIMLAISQQLEKHSHGQDYLPRFEQLLQQEIPELQTEGSHAYSAGSRITLPMQAEVEFHPNHRETYSDTARNWEPTETAGDLLPSYVNCMGDMRKTHLPKSHHQKHSYHNSKNPKAHTELKQYV